MRNIRPSLAWSLPRRAQVRPRFDFPVNSVGYGTFSSVAFFRKMVEIPTKGRGEQVAGFSSEETLGRDRLGSGSMGRDRWVGIDGSGSMGRDRWVGIDGIDGIPPKTGFDGTELMEYWLDSTIPKSIIDYVVQYAAENSGFLNGHSFVNSLRFEYADRCMSPCTRDSYSRRSRASMKSTSRTRLGCIRRARFGD